MALPIQRMYCPETAREIARDGDTVLYRKKSFEFFTADADGENIRPIGYAEAEEFVLANAPGQVWQKEFAIPPYDRNGRHVVKLNSHAWCSLRRESTLTGVPISDLVCRLVDQAGWSGNGRGER